MPWLPFYADEEDFRVVLGRLNADEESAVIVPNGAGRWVAKRTVDGLADGCYCLWHIPSGPLPLLFRRAGKIHTAAVEDPFAGWEARLTGHNPSVPYFGIHPGVIVMAKVTQGVESPDAIGMSGFSWIGNRYRAIGYGAAESTGKWWRRLRRWVRKQAVRRIPRKAGLEPEIWVFPSAYRRIAGGVGHDVNPPVC